LVDPHLVGRAYDHALRDLDRLLGAGDARLVEEGAGGIERGRLPAARPRRPIEEALPDDDRLVDLALLGERAGPGEDDLVIDGARRADRVEPRPPFAGLIERDEEIGSVQARVVREGPVDRGG